MTLKLGRKFPTLDQELPEASTRPAQPRLDGAEGDALSLGGLLVAQALDVAQHHDDPLVVWQRRQPLLDHADSLGGQGGALRPDPPIREARRLAGLLDDHVQRGRWAALAPAQQVVAGVDGDPEQPGLERATPKLTDRP